MLSVMSRLITLTRIATVVFLLILLATDSQGQSLVEFTLIDLNSPGSVEKVVASDVDEDGGIVSVGTINFTNAPGSVQGCIVKTTKHGQVLWSKRIQILGQPYPSVVEFKSVACANPGSTFESTNANLPCNIIAVGRVNNQALICEFSSSGQLIRSSVAPLCNENSISRFERVVTGQGTFLDANGKKKSSAVAVGIDGYDFNISKTPFQDVSTQRDAVGGLEEVVQDVIYDSHCNRLYVLTNQNYLDGVNPGIYRAVINTFEVDHPVEEFVWRWSKRFWLGDIEFPFSLKLTAMAPVYGQDERVESITLAGWTNRDLDNTGGGQHTVLMNVQVYWNNTCNLETGNGLTTGYPGPVSINWYRNYNIDLLADSDIHDMAIATNGEVVILGSEYGPAFQNPFWFVAHFSSGGNLMWTEQLQDADRKLTTLLSRYGVNQHSDPQMSVFDGSEVVGVGFSGNNLNPANANDILIANLFVGAIASEQSAPDCLVRETRHEVECIPPFESEWQFFSQCDGLMVNVGAEDIFEGYTRVLSCECEDNENLSVDHGTVFSAGFAGLITTSAFQENSKVYLTTGFSDATPRWDGSSAVYNHLDIPIVTTLPSLRTATASHHDHIGWHWLSENSTLPDGEGRSNQVANAVTQADDNGTLWFFGGFHQRVEGGPSTYNVHNQSYLHSGDVADRDGLIVATTNTPTIQFAKRIGISTTMQFSPAPLENYNRIPWPIQSGMSTAEYRDEELKCFDEIKGIHYSSSMTTPSASYASRIVAIGTSNADYSLQLTTNQPLSDRCNPSNRFGGLVFKSDIDGANATAKWIKLGDASIPGRDLVLFDIAQMSAFSSTIQNIDPIRYLAAGGIYYKYPSATNINDNDRHGVVVKFNNDISVSSLWRYHAQKSDETEEDGDLVFYAVSGSVFRLGQIVHYIVGEFQKLDALTVNKVRRSIVLCIDENGDVIWSRFLDLSRGYNISSTNGNPERFEDVIIADNGELLITGTCYVSNPVQNFRNRTSIVRMTQNGDVVWQKFTPNESLRGSPPAADSYAYTGSAILEDDDGSIYLTGHANFVHQPLANGGSCGSKGALTQAVLPCDAEGCESMDLSGTVDLSYVIVKSSQMPYSVFEVEDIEDVELEVLGPDRYTSQKPYASKRFCPSVQEVLYKRPIGQRLEVESSPVSSFVMASDLLQQLEADMVKNCAGENATVRIYSTIGVLLAHLSVLDISQLAETFGTLGEAHLVISVSCYGSDTPRLYYVYNDM